MSPASTTAWSSTPRSRETRVAWPDSLLPRRSAPSTRTKRLPEDNDLEPASRSTQHTRRRDAFGLAALASIPRQRRWAGSLSRANARRSRAPRSSACSRRAIWGGGRSRRVVAACGSQAEHGPVNADQVKRLTRAGMGHCQGRLCREQVVAAAGRGVRRRHRRYTRHVLPAAGAAAPAAGHVAPRRAGAGAPRVAQVVQPDPSGAGVGGRHMDQRGRRRHRGRRFGPQLGLFPGQGGAGCRGRRQGDRRRTRPPGETAGWSASGSTSRR